MLERTSREGAPPGKGSPFVRQRGKLCGYFIVILTLSTKSKALTSKFRGQAVFCPRCSNRSCIAANGEPGVQNEDFVERVRVNQAKLTSELKSHYDFIICGSGSSGSVVARRLAENPDVSVLLLEAGGSDDVPSVIEAAQWPANLGSERDWDFRSEPNPHLNGRSIPLNMGKVLGGGSSINVMAWARGHKNDWDFFAAEAGDTAWNYESVLNIYRRIED